MTATAQDRSWMNLRIFPIAGQPGRPALEVLEEWAYAQDDKAASPLVNMPKRPQVRDFVLATGNELAYAIDEMRTRVALGGDPTPAQMGWVEIQLGALEGLAAVG